MRRALGSVAALAITCGTVVPALAAAPRFPATQSALVGGLPIVSEPDNDAALTGVQIFVAAGLERQTLPTSGVAALTAECLLRTPVKLNGTTSGLNDAINRGGGSLSYTIDESTVHYYLESQPQRMPQLLGIFAAALASPDFSAATISDSRRVLAARVDEAQKNPFRVGLEMFKESFLPNGMAFPDYGTGPSLAALGPSALRDFYARTYRRGGVTATAIGRVTPEVTQAVGKVAEALPAGTVAPLAVKGRALPTTTRQIVAQRDVSRPFIVIGFSAPSPGQHDFGAMLLVENLLSTAFDEGGATTAPLGERAVGALYLYDSTPASLVIYVNGGTGVDPALALRAITTVTKRLASTPLSADALKRLKVTTEGQFVTSATSLADRSYLIGALSATGLGNKAINGALDAIESTTSAEIQQAAKTYLQRFIVAIVAPRQRS